MPTVADTIRINGEGRKTRLVIDYLEGPRATTGGVDSRSQRTVLTDDEGDFSVALAPGLHTIGWRVGAIINHLKFVLPDSDGTYTLGDIEVPESISVDHTEFPSVQAMLESKTELWNEALCWSWSGVDSIHTLWVKTGEPGLTDNGGDIRQAEDGQFLLRYWSNA